MMTEQPAKRRRVPAELRKRSQQSCDLCRKRRCKCVPSTISGTCLVCQENGSPCTYATPRKTRFYGSVDDLSDRYRCLEAIVRGAFPNEPTSTTAELLTLGERRGYQMPDLSDGNAPGLGELTKQAYPTLSAQHVHSRGEEPLTQDAISSAASIQPYVHGSENSPQSADPIAVDSPGLVRDAAGQPHYIGPSGSLAFFAELRNLVSSREPFGNTSTFAQDDIAQALEEVRGTIETETTPLPDDSPGSAGFDSNKDAGPSEPDMIEYIKELPPQPIMDALLDSYFENAHPDFPLFHRATFEDEYESYILRPRGYMTQKAPNVISTTGKESSRPDWGWILSLHMMLAFGSIHNTKLTSAEDRLLCRKSINTARALLSKVAVKSSLSHLRALLLLSLYLHNNTERNAAWNLVGAAIRVALALGLHKDVIGISFRPIEREMRKRVFCTLYCFEQFLCSSLGRPSGINDFDIDVRAPREGFLDEVGGVSAQYITINLELQAILVKSRKTSVLWKDGDKSLHRDYETTPQGILKSLQAWKSKLPGHILLPGISSQNSILSTCLNGHAEVSFHDLKLSLSRQPSAQLRSLILLHILYHYIAILVTRPALLQEIASSTPTEYKYCSPDGSAYNFSDICIYHAFQLAYLIILLDHLGILNGVAGLDIFYAYSAGMVLVLRLLRIYPPDSFDEKTRIKEGTLQDCLYDLVQALRNVISRADKCRTMTRLTGVLNKFAESSMSYRDRNLSLAMGDHSQEGSHFESGATADENNSSPLPLPPPAPPPWTFNNIGPGRYHGNAASNVPPTQGSLPYQFTGRLPPEGPTYNTNPSNLGHMPIVSMPGDAGANPESSIANAGPSNHHHNMSTWPRGWDAMANGPIFDWADLETFMTSGGFV